MLDRDHLHPWAKPQFAGLIAASKPMEAGVLDVCLWVLHYRHGQEATQGTRSRPAGHGKEDQVSKLRYTLEP